MQFNLEQNEIGFIMQVLGELPSKTGAFVLMQNLEGQIKEQEPAPPQE